MGNIERKIVKVRYFNKEVRVHTASLIRVPTNIEEEHSVVSAENERVNERVNKRVNEREHSVVSAENKRVNERVNEREHSVVSAENKRVNERVNERVIKRGNKRVN